MSHEHPRALKAISAIRGRLAATSRTLRRLEVAAAQGVRRTHAASRSGWEDSWESIRPDCRPVFTLSTGRTGTMSLALLAGLSTELEAVHEPLPHLFVESYLEYSGVRQDVEFWNAVVEEARDWPIRDAYHRGRRWFETNNRLAFLAPYLHNVYPSAQFMLVTRHPETFAESALSRGYYRGHSWDFARITPRPEDPAHERWNAMSQLEQVGWLWAETYRRSAEFADLHPSNTIHIRSEDLFSDGEATSARLFSFLQVEAEPDPAAVRSLLAVPANAQAKTAASDRSSWDASSKSAFIAQVDGLMDRFGYQAL